MPLSLDKHLRIDLSLEGVNYGYVSGIVQELIHCYSSISDYGFAFEHYVDYVIFIFFFKICKPLKHVALRVNIDYNNKTEYTYLSRES